MTHPPFTVVDLFSGGGGMSFGFQTHPDFQVIGAADAQRGKPSSKEGSLGCNSTYELNIGLRPLAVDLAHVEPAQLRAAMGITAPIDVLAACPPCTGFSRTLASNHLVDDERNNLVRRVAAFAAVFKPSVIVMENARELVSGNFAHHLARLRKDLKRLGYTVHADTHLLSDFGLPQVRERALVIAVRRGLAPRSLPDLWEGHAVDRATISVRQAIGALPALESGSVDSSDPDHVSPRFLSAVARGRLAAIPEDGGSWRALIGSADTERYLTPGMRRLIDRGKLGSHPDVYGRMWWDRPAPTIKRECGHVGNGRYAHPEQDRLCSLRELAILNGFPSAYRFGGGSLSNKYRHVGDAVPPLISYQIAAATSWTLTGRRPAMSDIVLPDSTLSPADIHPRTAAAA